MWKNLIEMMIGPIVEFLYKFLSSKKKERTFKALKDNVKIYKEMDLLVEEPNIDRVMLCYVHNCGGKIQPGRQRFYSIIEEARNGLTVSRIDKYQRQICDMYYLSAIISSIYSESKTSKIIVDNFPANNTTKDIYIYEDVKEDVMAYIASNEESIWYLSIATRTSIDLNEDLFRKLYSARNVIANILEEYYSLSDRI